MKFINWLGSLYSKLPKFSPELKNFIVKILPWVVFIGGILITFASVAEIVGSPFLSIFSLNGGAKVFQTLLIVNVIGIIQGILMIAALRPLRRNSKNGWRLVFWSQMLWMFSAVINLSPSFILGLLFLYPLFQVKSHYR
jgi:hypothetical protein